MRFSRTSGSPGAPHWRRCVLRTIRQVDGSFLEATNLARLWGLAGKGVYYVSRTPAISMTFFDFATRQTRRLFDLANKPVPGTPGPAVSPDGRWILYSQMDREGNNIMLLQNFE